MAQLDGTPYWQESAPMSRYPALDRNIKVDVAIVGAGITGLTAAYLLKRAGRTVAVIDRGRCGGVDTGHTTAHVTCVTDLDLSALVKHFGRDHAQAAWDAGLAALFGNRHHRRGQRASTATGHGCRATKFAALTANAEEEGPRLQQEAAIAAELGFDARYLDAVPFFDRPGIEFDGQARFHPRKYLAALAACVERRWIARVRAYRIRRGRGRSAVGEGRGTHDRVRLCDHCHPHAAAG